MVEVLSMLIGFLVGVVAAGIAVELGLRKFLSPPENTKITRVWSLAEIPKPLIVARAMRDVPFPKNARVVAGQKLDGERAGFDLRSNPEAVADFAVDAEQPRALLFLGGIQKGAMALWTVDERLIDRLRAEFNRLWSRSTDYIERVNVAELPGKANHAIETEGTVQDTVPFKGQYLMRLADKGETIGVLVDQDLHLTGKRVAIKGHVRASSSGYPLVEALEVRAA